jgi:hypothetical protein
MELYSSAGVGHTISYTIESPLLEGQPLPVLFGPFENHFFGLGDYYNPGRLYHTRGNDPDSMLPEFYIDVTDPSDPLQNGCVWNGRAYVWSTKRMFQILPTPGGAQRFRSVEVAGGRGITDRHAFAHGGAGMFWLDRDGIYASQGGPAQCISDDIKTLFPIAGARPTYINDPPGVADGGVPGIRIETPGHRLSFAHNTLYYCYFDAIGDRNVLVYDMTSADPSRHGWWYDVYASDVQYWFEDDSASDPSVFAMGSDDVVPHGVVCRLYEVIFSDDDGSAITCAFVTPYMAGDGVRNEKRWGDCVVEYVGDGGTISLDTWFDHGEIAGNNFSANGNGMTLDVIDQGSGDGVEARNIGLYVHYDNTGSAIEFLRWEPSWISYPPDTQRRGTDFWDEGKPVRKYVRGVIIEADTLGVAVGFDVVKDLGAVARPVGWTDPPDQPTLSITHAIRHEAEYGLTPFTTALLSLRPRANNGLKLFKHVWIFDPYPFIAETPTPWDDAGDMRAKFVQGMVLKADTANASVNVEIQSDGETVEHTIAIQHDGQVVKPYSWEPFITHQVRIVPLGGVGIFEVKWIWEPEPELTTHWEGQETTHDGKSWLHLRDMWLSAMLTTDTQTLTIVITADGTDYTVYAQGTSGAGLIQKMYVQVPAIKARHFRYQITSAAAFRLYAKNSEVRYKHWGDEGPYRVALPFGDESRAVGARI